MAKPKIKSDGRTITVRVPIAIRKRGGRMTSILTSYDGVEPGYRKVYIRIYDVNRTELALLQNDLTEKAQLLYMVDHRENRRVIFQ